MEVEKLQSLSVQDIDLQFTKNYLRVDYDEDDQFIEMCIISAKSYVQNYLNQRFTDFEEEPKEFSIAILSIIAHWYENRQIQSERQSKEELRHIFSGILDYHRKWIDFKHE